MIFIKLNINFMFYVIFYVEFSTLPFRYEFSTYYVVTHVEIIRNFILREYRLDFSLLGEFKRNLINLAVEFYLEVEWKFVDFF